jgi:luciferase family oxidoreductase group 1
MTTLSVLDLATVARGATAADALADTVRMAPEVERLGYRRMWVAEHHGMPMVASSAPAVLIGHLANVTTTLRVGAGGVMLPNHAPLVIAEQFGTLEALHPGRIDLGLGRAPGTDQVTARALRRAAEVGPDTFPDDVVELINYLLDRDAPASLPAAMPGRGYLPEMWLLGSSTFSAQLAGMLGLNFSFAYHFAPGLVDQALALYRSTFTPSILLDAPHAMVAVSVVCAPDEDEARWLAGPSGLTMLQLRTGRPGPVATPEEAAAYRYTDPERALIESATASHLVGDPEQVHRGLVELEERTGADEIMLSTRAHSFDARLQTLSLVAERWAAGQHGESSSTSAA